MLPRADFWSGKRVLLTGHTGFKGAWLALWLHRMGALVCGVSLAASTKPNLSVHLGSDHLYEEHFCDIRDRQRIGHLVNAFQPEVVFHLAAQALVRAGYQDPVNTFTSNVIGSVNVLDALRQSRSTRVIVVVTTDKVYENREWLYPYREIDPLGGHDPYSASKAATELVVSSYRNAFFRIQGVAVASARAGNVIGGGDWAPDRLIPDAIRAWTSDTPLQIRRPDAVRPWQHVLDPLAGYVVLAERLWREPDVSGAYNFGPAAGETRDVRTVVTLANAAFGSGNVEFSVQGSGPHEAELLMLDVAKSEAILGFRPCWNLAETIDRTMSWYTQFNDGISPWSLCIADICAYEEQA